MVLTAPKLGGIGAPHPQVVQSSPKFDGARVYLRPDHWNRVFWPGWRAAWVVQCVRADHDGDEVNFLTCDLEYLEHSLREALRLAVWEAATMSRDDMAGAEHGIDRDISLFFFPLFP